MTFEALPWCASIFFWSLFTGIGIPPIPEEAGILYAASLAAIHPEVRWWMAWPAATLGIVAADLVLYGAGWFFGRLLLEHRWLLRILPVERRQRIEDHFHRHGMKFLLLARLLPPLRTGVFIVAGMIHYSFVRFLIADALYGVVGVGLVFFGGIALMSLVHHVGNWLIVVLTLAAVGVALFYYFRYLRKLELKAASKVGDVVTPLLPAEKRPHV